MNQIKGKNIQKGDIVKIFQPSRFYGGIEGEVTEVSEDKYGNNIPTSYRVYFEESGIDFWFNDHQIYVE